MICDTAVNSFMLSVENPALTAVSKVIGLVFEPRVLFFLSLIVAAYLFFKSSKAKGILFGVAIIVASGLIVALKEIIRRVRPVDSVIPEWGFSFPSGHATMAVVFLGLLVYLFVKKKYKIKAMVVASLLVLIIGASRVYLKVHWMTDVLAGFVLGGLILTVGIFLFRKFD